MAIHIRRRAFIDKRLRAIATRQPLLPRRRVRSAGVASSGRVPWPSWTAPQSSIGSLRFSCRFLLIPIGREAPSYQPLDLSLAVRLVFFFLAVADVLSFGACTTVRSFLDMYRRPLDKRTPVFIAMARPT